MIKIGFIVGKYDQIYKNNKIKKSTPKKYLHYGDLHVDVAIAMHIKMNYPDIYVDIILPKDISKERLRKNNVNFHLGYDCLNSINNEPIVKKFSTDQGIKEIFDIFKDKSCKIFPPFEHNNFTWNKKLYMTKYKKNNLPIPDSIFFKPNNSIKKLLNQIKTYGWDTFIIKPNGGTTANGFRKFVLNDCLNDTSLINDYIKENNSFKEFIIQLFVKGFDKYGEIKMIWINNEFSYAINIKRKDFSGKNEDVVFVKDKKVLEECKKIGQEAIDLFPPIFVNRKKVNPVLVRTDFACCLDDDDKKKKYFLNEVENQCAHTYSDKKGITYPFMEVIADNFVKKAQELVKLGF